MGYRLDYSRNELKKCIKEYPGKEVCVRIDLYVNMCTNANIGEAWFGEVISSCGEGSVRL